MKQTKKPKSDLRFIKVFGERNTGTRAIIGMLRATNHIRLRAIGSKGVGELSKGLNIGELEDKIKNRFRANWHSAYSSSVGDLRFHQVPPTHVWKHSAPYWDETYKSENGHVIFVTRNPYSWLISTAKRPYHIKGPRPGSLNEFINRPWICEMRDNIGPLIASPLELWNRKTKAYIEFEKQAKMHEVPTCFLKFEDFIENPETVLKQALEGFDIDTNGIAAIGTSTKKDGRNLDEIGDYYRNEGWKEWLTSVDVSEINEIVDWEIADKFGYKKLSPDKFPEKLSAVGLAKMKAALSKDL